MRLARRSPVRTASGGSRLDALFDDHYARMLRVAYTMIGDQDRAERRRKLGMNARRAGLHEVADFVLPPAEEPTPDDDKRRAPDLGRGRPLTLGERKSLARTHDRTLIQRVVQDPHPEVVRILLGNPSLTEHDVVRICAARPNDSQVLQTVYRSRRWVVRYRPRNAIVRNPDTPVDIALLLAPLLRRPELREAATSSELAPTVRLSCRTILEARSGRSVPPKD